jgi:hypothetical protein
VAVAVSDSSEPLAAFADPGVQFARFPGNEALDRLGWVDATDIAGRAWSVGVELEVQISLHLRDRGLVEVLAHSTYSNRVLSLSSRLA